VILQSSNTAGIVVLGLCALVLFEYLVRWSGTAGHLPRLRHPLYLMWLAIRRLWRNRSLVAILIGLALVSALIYYFWLTPVRYEGLAAARGWSPDALSARIRPGLFTFNPNVLIYNWRDYVLQSAPSLAWNRLPQWGAVKVYDYGLSGLLPLLALATALVVFVEQRPRWLAPGLHRRLFWPAAFTVAAAFLGLFWTYLGTYGLAHPLSLSSPFQQFFLMVVGVVFMIMLAPTTAFAWSLSWQIARGQRWNLRQAIRDTLRHWLNVLVVVAVMSALYHSLFLAVMLSSPLVSFWGRASFHAVGSLPAVVMAATFFLPWIIVGDSLDWRRALRRLVAVWQEHGQDLAVYVLRYVAVMVLAGVPLALVEMASSGLVDGFLLDTLKLLYRLIGAMSLVIFYVEIRKTDRKTGALQPALRPGAKATV